MIYFVGAGSGAIDLLTVKGKDLLERAGRKVRKGFLGLHWRALWIG